MYSITLGILLLVGAKYLMLTAPFVPTKNQDLQRISILAKKYKIKQLCDLGCGNGRVINHLAKNNQAMDLVGIELASFLYLINLFRFIKRKNVKIKYGNVFWHDWSDFDSLFMFWHTSFFNKHVDKIIDKIKPGQLIISYCFELKDLKDKLLIKDQPKAHLPIYVYRI